MLAVHEKNLPPVVIIHGMWSTPDTLTELKQAFETEGYVTHTPRLPLHLPRHQLDEQQRKQLARLSVQDYVQSIAQFLDTLEQPPILVGHSMGGLLAQLIAAKYPCKKLILLSSAPPAGVSGFYWSVLRTFGHSLFKFPLWRSTTNLLLKNIRYGIANTQHASIHREISQNSTLESGRVTWQISMWFMYKHPPTKVEYDKIQCPVLIMSGTEDKITPFKSQLKIAQKYGERASFSAIIGACHWTIGGSHFSKIKHTLFSWLNQSPDQKNFHQKNIISSKAA